MKNAPPQPSPGEPPPHPPHHVVHLTLTYRVLAVFVALLILPWVLALVTLGYYFPSQPKDKPQVASTQPSAMLVGQEIDGNPGPWGNLVYIPIHISPPDEFLDAERWKSVPRLWHLPNMALADVQALLAQKDLTEAQRMVLLATLQPEPEMRGFTLRPPDDVIQGLSAQARGRLYGVLAQSPLNVAQADAFRFCGASLDEWMGGSPLDRETLDFIRPLFYRNGRYLFFADMPLAAAAIRSPDERAHLVKALSHEATFLVRLKISDPAEVDSLVAYWGRGGRAMDVQPMIQSLAELPGTHRLAVTYLLPGFARQRTFTYPAQSEATSPVRRDCHWSALNFFNEDPDDRLADPQVAKEVLAKDYYIIYSGYQLGDLVCLMTGPGEVLHSAVYVADGVVFTQSGNQPTHPWLFARVDDLKDYYPSAKPVSVTYFRHKGV